MNFWPFQSRNTGTRTSRRSFSKRCSGTVERLEERRLLTVSAPEVSVEILQDGAEQGLVDTVFQFQRTGSTSESLTVDAFLLGTARGDVDFQSPANTDAAGRFSITFSVGNSTANLTLPTLADNEHDPAETLLVVLDSGPTYSISPGNDRALGVISELNTSTTLHDTNRTSQSRSTHRNDYAFAAIIDNGSIAVWGSDSDGGFIDDEIVDLDGSANNLTIQSIVSNEAAFAAIRSDGSVITWGSEYHGGDPTRQDFTSIDFDGVGNNAQVVSLHSTNNAFSAILSDNSVVAWGGDIDGDYNDGNIVPGGTTATSIASTFHAFAAIETDGTVQTWGDPTMGGNSAGIDWNGSSNNLDVVEIFATDYAFAALRDDGSVVTWGNNESDAENEGGDSSSIDFNGPSNNRYVVDITATSVAFAALFNDGTVATWGNQFDGGNSSTIDFDGPNDDLHAVKIYSTDYAFSALLNDGSIVSWGRSELGGDSSNVDFDGSTNDLQVVDVVANDYAFAAIRSDGSVVSWGSTSRGGDSSLENFAGKKVIGITPADRAFAALLEDGDVVTWGDAANGGDSSAINFVGDGNSLKVTSIVGNSAAFAAIQSDGSVVSWGRSEYGGDSSNADFNGENGLAKVVALSSPSATTTLLNPTNISATTLESQGNTALNQRDDSALLANSTVITLNGSPITTSLFGQWTVFEAEQINGTNKISAKHNQSGVTNRWSADASWALNGYFSMESPTSIVLTRSNSSGPDPIESEYTIDAAGAVQLSMLEDLRLLASGNELTRVDSLGAGSNISQSSFADSTPIAAETVNGQNRLLLRTSGGLMKEVYFDNAWVYDADGVSFSLTGQTAINAELNFVLDLDGNGIIGTLGS